MHFEYLENGNLIEQSNEINLKIAKLKEIDIHVYYKDKDSQIDIAEMKTITGKIGEKYKETPIDIEGYVLTRIQRIQKASSPKIQRISIFITEKANFISQLLLNMSILENIKYPVDH